MVAVPSTMLPIGTKAPNFLLQDPCGSEYTLSDFTAEKGYCIMFLCNHCPYVKHIQKKLASIAGEYSQKGIIFIGISSNDIDRYPEDSPDRMSIEASQAGYVFPYLYDKTQDVAKDYQAACTPDFFVFDKNQELFYRGQFDDSRPNNKIAVNGEDLRHALECVISGKAIPESDQKPSIGCNIKWKPGNAPDYFEH